MELLKTIKFKEVTDDVIKTYRFRQAARAIVFNSENKIGLIHNGKYSYHKLPGGGVESGEELLTTVKRECQEELGCEIDVIGELGYIVEYKDEFKLHHESYCYIAKIVKGSRIPVFTKEELDDNFSAQWVTLEEAIELLENDRPQDIQGRYVNQRDLTFLKEYKSRRSRTT